MFISVWHLRPGAQENKSKSRRKILYATSSDPDAWCLAKAKTRGSVPSDILAGSWHLYLLQLNGIGHPFLLLDEVLPGVLPYRSKAKNPLTHAE